MKIEKIQKLKNGKYKLEFDNAEKIITYDEVILKNNLLFHQKLAEKELNQLQKDTENYDVYYRCIKFISKKIRSEKEIRDYIYKIIERDDENTIKRLKEQGFINDKMFTSAYIYDRINLSNEGPLKIKSSLLNHHISEEMIDFELEKYSQQVIDEKLIRLLKKKLKNNNKYSKYILKQKILLYFSELGYDKEKINLYFDQYYIENKDAIEKDYQKIKKVLEKKYPMEDIKFKIYQKLYQKGYSKEEIDEIIQNSEL